MTLMTYRTGQLQNHIEPKYKLKPLPAEPSKYYALEGSSVQKTALLGSWDRKFLLIA